MKKLYLSVFLNIILITGVAFISINLYSVQTSGILTDSEQPNSTQITNIQTGSTQSNNSVWYKTPIFDCILKILQAGCNIAVVVAAGFSLKYARLSYLDLLARHKNEMKEKDEEKRMYNFRKIILENKFTDIEEFFDRTEALVEDFKVLKESEKILKSDTLDCIIRKKIEEYTKMKMNIAHNFIDIAKNIDGEFGKKLDTMFEEFQDDFTNNVVFLMKGKIYCRELADIICEQRKATLKEIFRF